MHWQDDGIVLSARRHGESSAVAVLLTRSHGLHAGLVRGGAGRRLKGVLTTGNQVAAAWSGRLPEHLGNYRIEPRTAFAVELLDDPLRLAALASACALVEATLPEHEAHPAVYDGLCVLFDSLNSGVDDWPAIYVRWELGLLTELGFGLDLERCAATGQTTGLTHVSPKSGRAVSAEAAAPYLEHLLVLPPFLAQGRGGPPANNPLADIRDGLALTGYFFEDHVFMPHQVHMPPARTRLAERFAREAAKSGAISPA